MGTKAKQERLVETLKAWQRVENRSALQAAGVFERARNPVIRMVMEIIQRDSAMHYRVQQLLIESYENQAIAMSVDDLEHVWAAIQAHIDLERKTADLVAAARDALAGTNNPVPQFLLAYLAYDEKKHDQLLEDLNLVKRGMYRSA
ncbi:MAG TPA: hypothetical protein VLD85_00280 [Anaeromyxobacteraceae bacterium]|nr:hypothetical protein [Anaeromyxobacteraceae bacterium]